MIRLLSGDARDVLPTLAAESVQCVVTSPPYYALRSYLDATHPEKHREIGSEATPDEYLATLVGVFREVRRVLRRDGTCWVNMGDSYAAAPSGGFDKGNRGGGALGGGGFRSNTAFSTVGNGYKPKDLLLMPARLALALQADGWWVRSQMPWIKRSCMPESTNDRPTSAVEYVFMLTKSPRYFWDAEAVKKRGAIPKGTRAAKGSNIRSELKDVNGRPPEYWDYTGTRNFRNSDLFFSSIEEPYGLIMDADGLPIAIDVNPQPFKESHFATFPPSLVAPLLLGATSERGCCAACGKPWVRTTETAPDARVPYATVGLGAKAAMIGNDGSGLHKVLREDGRGGDLATIQRTTTGWSPGCDHDAPTVPCTVLDPFAGAGTTLLVADRLQRDAVGIELNTAYTEMAMERCRADAPLFTSFPPAEPPEDERMADLFTDMAAD